jgi:uncharacterized membrane protein
MIDYDPYLSERVVGNVRRAGLAASLLLLVIAVGPFTDAFFRAPGITGMIATPFYLAIAWSLILAAVDVVRQLLFILELLIRFLAQRNTDARNGSRADYFKNELPLGHMELSETGIRAGGN